jgi:hypothetical protein
MRLIPSDVLPFGTLTGRTSGLITTLPNPKAKQLQKIGTTVKNHVHCAPPGYKFCNFDFSALELVIAAAFNSLEYCQREGLTLEPDSTDAAKLVFTGQSALQTDVHTVVAKQVGVPRPTVKTLEYACLPLGYKVLTKKGWKLGHDIGIGEEVLGYKNGALEWGTNLKTHKYSNKEVWDFGLFASTPDHRWIAKSRKKLDSYGPHELRDIIKHKNWKIKIAAAIQKKDSLLTINESKILAWLLTDGSFTFGKRQYASYICQGKSVFKQDIEKLLIDEGALSWKTKVKSVNLECWRFYIKHGYLKALLKKCDQPVLKKIDFDLEKILFQLGTGELQAFCQVICDAEGTEHSKGVSWRIAQNDTKLGQDFRTCFALAGYKVTCNTPYINKYGNSVRYFTVSKKQHIVSDTLLKKVSKTFEDVWCLTTTTDSFMVMSPKGHIAVLFNCLYGSSLTGLESVARPELPDLSECELSLKCSNFQDYFKGKKIKYTPYWAWRFIQPLL